MSMPDRRKLVELEALRGIAATIVLLHHFLLFAAPRLHGRNFPDDPIALVRTPLFALVNGTGAVAIFFVLSGFVLTFRTMENRDGRQLLLGAVKRWPRLFPLVVVVNVLSAIFFLLGLYGDNSWFNLGRYSEAGPLPVIGGAVIEGAFSTFIYQKDSFNAALWTMHYELFGSFAAYATALILIFQQSFVRALVAGAAALVVTATLTGEGGIYFAMLVAGVLIARIYLESDRLADAAIFRDPWRIPLVIGVAALAIVFLGYDGYSKPVGFYAFMAPFSSPRTEELVHGMAAVAIVSLVLFYEPIRRQLIGPTAALLGRLSFSIYLVHLPILHGLVAPLHSLIAKHIGSAVAVPAAFLIFIALTAAAAYPLAHFDEWWVRKLRAITGRAAPKTSASLHGLAGR